MRLIDADEAYKVLTDYYHHKTEIQHKALKEAIERVSTVDAVEVVRCKDCKHVYCRIYHGWQEPIYTCTHLRSRWNTDNDLEVNPDGFCSYGERREGRSMILVLEIFAVSIVIYLCGAVLYL